MDTSIRKVISTTTLAMGLMLSVKGFSAESTLPKKPEVQPQTSQSVQPDVNKKTTDALAEKRKVLIADAQTAIAEADKALQALNKNKNDEALEALAITTGKLELVLARNPKLALAPVRTEVVMQDLLTNKDTVRAVFKQAKEYLRDGEVQKARPLIAVLASEIQFRTVNVPLETYPAAIKAITPLIDAGKIDEAKTRLQTTLNTLVVTTEAIPLPKLRAEQMLKAAQALAEKKGRSKDDNGKLAINLQGAREQLELAELLGYGTKQDYKTMYAQLDEILKKSADGNSGMDWFDKIKKQISDLV